MEARLDIYAYIDCPKCSETIDVSSYIGDYLKYEGYRHCDISETVVCNCGESLWITGISN